jgi:hypothetical protein
MSNGVAIPPGLLGVGNARYANLSAAKSLTDAPTAGDTLPDGATPANYALIVTKTQSVYISFDGDAATADDFELPVDTPMWLENARTVLANLSLLQSQATAAVSIAYFYGPQG